MPSNELGDRVHNFFAQDNSLQGHHHSQVVEGNWPVLNSNFWVGSQRQVDLLNSNNKNYTQQTSDVDRGEGSYPLHEAHDLNFTQPNLRHDFARSQSLNEQPNLNGFMYGNEFQQTRQNEANFLAVDTDSDQRLSITSRGLSVREVQQASGPDHYAKAPIRSGTSVSPVSFDLFGGHQQMSHQQSTVPQSLQRQQSGINDMQQFQHQQFQHQLMIRKMQELQRQQQLQQLGLRQQDLINQVPPFAKQASGTQTTLVNGTPNSDSYPWSAELSTNWLNRGSPTMQVSANGLGFPPNLGQAQHSVDLVAQQVDQSLYGVPISSSRGLPVNQYSQMVTDRSSMPQMSTSSNFLQDNQHNLLPDQAGVQKESSISRHKFQNENMFGLSSRQSPNAGMRNMGGLQQVNSMSRNAPQQDFLGRQDLAIRPDTSCEKPTRQAASPQNEVALGLDPTEEKILFGSDDNIWSAFGKPTHTTGEAGNLFDNGGLSNGLPSIQSGSWSALMQSAVAETSSSDMPPQEGWSGLNFNNNDGPSGSQPLSLNNDSCKQVPSLADDSMQMPSAQSSGSFAPPDDINTNNVMGLNQIGQKFQNEPGQRLQTEMSQRFFQSLEEAGKWSNSGQLQSSVAEGSPLYTDASQHSLQAERNAKTNSPTWVSGHTGTRLQSNGWNSLEAIPPGGERMMNNHKAEKLHQNSQNSQVRVMHGEVVHGSSLWKLNSVHSSATELGHVKSKGASSPANQGTLSSKNDASVANSCNARISEETSPFVQHNYLLNQWKNAHPSTRSQGAESLVRSLDQANDLNQVLDPMNSREKDDAARHARHEIDNCDGKENSNDSHRSNLSQHTSGSFREGDSRSLPIGKQNSTNQLSRKVSAPRKFQYHPMGNVDEDVGTYAHKQPTRSQAMYQQTAHFGQSKIFGQAPTNSTLMEKEQSSELQRDIEGPDEVPSRGILPGQAPNVPVHFSRSVDAYTSSNASSSSQNMLELLHKVDQSTNHGAMFSSSEGNASPQLPQAEKLDGVGSLQHSQASVSQGFGLQLGPPSQRLQSREHQLSSQNGHDAFNSYSSNAAAGMGGKDQQMVATHSGQSLASIEETQVEFKINRSAIPDHGGNENSLYKMPGNVNIVSSSAIPNSRSNVQNQQIMSSTGKMLVNQRIDSNGYSSYSAQRRLAETLLPDASGSFKQDNLASSGGTSSQTGPSDVMKRVPTTTIPTRDGKLTSQHFGMPGIPRQGYSTQMLHNMWTNVPTHQNNMSIQFQQASSHTQESSQPNILESSSPLAQGQVNSQGIVDGEDQRLKESSGQPVAFVNTDPVPEMEKSLGKASSTKNCLEDSPANSASTQKDIEAFGRSLRPNSFSHQNYSLLNQMQALKDAEVDSSNRVSKRMKGPESVSDVHIAALKAQQQNEHNAVGDSLGSSTGAPSEDSGMLNFTSPAEIFHGNTSQQGNVASQDMLVLGRDVSQSNSCGEYLTSARADHPQVGPQMAPSWFNQYGTFKNGQMLQIYDARKVTSLRPGEHVGKSSTGLDTLNSEEKGTAAPIDPYQMGNSHQSSIPSLVANGHFSSTQSLQLNVTGQHLQILRPKKRKSATSELHPWHRLISEGSQDLWTISMPEADWNKATNRLAEKVEDDAELIEDGPPMHRSKRRLTLTTHLMQQLLPPSPAAILSVDATTSYEIVAYAASRIALGDACSTVSRSSNLDRPCDSMDVLLAKSKLSERNGRRCYAKATEELMGRARKLENDFLRLDKSASILDLRLECQDLEKFSVINRFARFHGRGQSDNTEASTDTTPSAQKPIPQRYVTALPMPRSLPDRVQCLSL